MSKKAKRMWSKIKFEIQYFGRVINSKLFIMKYPFSKDCESRLCQLYSVPDGWFDLVKSMCAEIKSALTKEELASYTVLQAKEKFGELRWYDAGSSKALKKSSAIVDKYERLSVHTCICCGDTNAKMIPVGWMSPYCKKCYDKYRKNNIKKEWEDFN